MLVKQTIKNQSKTCICMCSKDQERSEVWSTGIPPLRLPPPPPMSFPWGWVWSNEFVGWGGSQSVPPLQVSGLQTIHHTKRRRRRRKLTLLCPAPKFKGTLLNNYCIVQDSSSRSWWVMYCCEKYKKKLRYAVSIFWLRFVFLLRQWSNIYVHSSNTYITYMIISIFPQNVHYSWGYTIHCSGAI